VRPRLASIALTGLALAALPLEGADAQERARIDRVVQAFTDVCLANASSLAAARAEALTPEWGFTSTGTLPGYNRAPPMETFKSGDLELVLRPNRNRFGCLLLTELGESEVTALRHAFAANPRLAPKGKHESGSTRYRWTLAEPKGSEVVVTVNYGPDRASTIIALESNGAPD
jgi:hypothetical protein